jgi:hypothetical protein
MLGWGANVSLASPSGSAAAPVPARTIDARIAAARAGRPLLAVSCSSARACTAVGGVFAERWNGRRWSVQNVPAPASSDPMFDFLGGVSCTARQACIAVGFERPSQSAGSNFDYSALAAVWRGSTWSDRSPTATQTRNGYLLAVSCPSSSDCIAVGQREKEVLAMRWHRNRWRVELAPGARQGVQSVLNGVSCVSATSCIAVGVKEPSVFPAPRALVERWNGRAWSIMRTPKTSLVQSTFLNAVWCDRTSCTAVGSVGSQPLVENYNGRTWSIQRTPASTHAAELEGVSCVSSADCVAVGGRLDTHQSIAERWNGTRWSIERTPTLASGSLLWGVSCPTAADCVAAGTRGGFPLLERWNGTRWSLQGPR